MYFHMKIYQTALPVPQCEVILDMYWASYCYLGLDRSSFVKDSTSLLLVIPEDEVFYFWMFSHEVDTVMLLLTHFCQLPEFIMLFFSILTITLKYGTLFLTRRVSK